MATFAPVIRKLKSSTPESKPVYIFDLAEIVNGEEPFKSLGIGSPKEFTEVEALLSTVEAALKKYVTSSDVIMWNHQDFTDVASAMEVIRSNPMADEELNGL
jgi:hypothetical protein